MAIADPDFEEELRERQREYLEFLDDSADGAVYTTKIQDLIQEQSVRLICNINDVRRKNAERAAGLLMKGFDEVIAFQRALKEMISTLDSDYAKKIDEFFIGFEGSFGMRHVTPRTMKSHFIGQMVCCEGIVTKCSLVRPKVVRSVHYCQATKKVSERRYTDLTSFEAFPTSTVYPTEDENHNPLETEYGLSTYKDHQTFMVQEMPENAPTGQLPRAVEVVADADLVDRCKPGDRVRAIGVFRCLPNKQANYTSGTFRTILIANNIQLMSKEAAPVFNAADVDNFRKFSRMRHTDVFDLLSRSLAPSIHGHEFVKKAILCMLLGGVEKVLPNGGRLRGDINLLLIGDPSVAKSQLLRYVLHTAPRAIPTTGRGSSGVGLTAAVTTDPESGERRLEAGAMVLADRGVVCIDEFDKMTDMDRTAIHEVMEQGRVTIAKAGIHARLNARCSVLAAANPVYGRYNPDKGPMENIGMQDSLLSRFDLLFIMLDKHNRSNDEMIAEFVLKMHQYRPPGEEDGAVLAMGENLQHLTTEDVEEERDDEKGTPIYEQNDSWIPRANAKEKFVSIRFMKKYIHIAKNVKPTLTVEAAQYIAQQYTEIRQSELKKSEKERTTPVTARTLETMIRLSTAHAKARLSKEVILRDAEFAYDLLYFACFKEAPKRTTERKRRKEAEGDDEVNTTAKKGKVNPDDPYEFDQDSEESTIELRPKRKRPESQEGVQDSEESEMTESVASISAHRYEQFRRLVRPIFTKAGVDNLPVEKVITNVQEGVRSKFTEMEVAAAIEKLGDDNAAMLSDGVLHLI